jgi:hypothetical protein
MWSLACWSMAFAGGFYHPADVAAASARFGEAQGQLMGPLEERQGAARTVSGALRSYREGLDLLGDRAPVAHHERLDELEGQYLRQFEALQRFADSLIGDFDGAFTAALDRALVAHPDAAVCAREIAVGPKVPGLGGRTQANPACAGDDLNATLAAAIDADAALIAALGPVLGRRWPELGVDRSTMAVVGEGERYVHVQRLISAGAGNALRAIEREDDEARVHIEASLEDGADAAELQRLQGDGSLIAANTASKRAALAKPVLDASDAALAKWGASEGAVGWCAQPDVLGGCAGVDQTEALVPRLLEHKKVLKALPRS